MDQIRRRSRLSIAVLSAVTLAAAGVSLAAVVSARSAGMAGAGGAGLGAANGAANGAAPDPAKGAAGHGPVVVELFTSQGCSSCPPADRLLSRLQGDSRTGGTVIPLAFHVDYWNRQGWSDPFSSEAWSQRQTNYAQAFHSNRIYTPQLVVGGRSECVGSEERLVMRRIHDALAAEPEGEVTLGTLALAAAASGGAGGAGSDMGVSGAGNGAGGAGGGAGGRNARVTVSARLLRPVGGGSQDVWVAVTESGLTTAVKAGENASATLHDDHVVRRLVKAFTLPPTAGAASSAEVALPLDGAWNGATLEVVAFIQDPRSLAIHGAAARPLAAR